MPGLNIGQAVLTLAVKADEFRKGIGKAKTETEKFAKDSERKTNRIRTAFSKAGTSIKNAASQVPILGGALSALATPLGAALTGVGLLAGAFTKMFTSTVSAARELGTVRETLEISAEPFQILSRIIEETNGNSGKLSDAMVRLRRMIGDASLGNEAAIKQFDALGLEWQDLVDIPVDQAIVKVITAANDSLTPTESAGVKATLLGRAYADLGGFANLTTGEMRDLIEQFRDAAVVTDEAVTATDDMDAALRALKQTSSGAGKTIATFFIDQAAAFLRLLNDLGKGIGKVTDGITWLGKAFGLNTPKVDDATDAADHLTAALNTTEIATEDVATVTETEATPALVDMTSAAGDTTEAVNTLITAQDDAAESARLWAEANREKSRQMIEDSQQSLQNVLTDYTMALQADRIDDDGIQTDDDTRIERQRSRKIGIFVDSLALSPRWYLPRNSNRHNRAVWRYGKRGLGRRNSRTRRVPLMAGSAGT